nr:KDGP aldolase [Gilliamella apicola]
MDLNNYATILKIALDAGVKKVIPHIYSSIIDKNSGKTKPQDVKTLMDMTRELL